jgi:hypothetical protein
MGLLKMGRTCFGIAGVENLGGDRCGCQGTDMQVRTGRHCESGTGRVWLELEGMAGVVCTESRVKHWSAPVGYGKATDGLFNLKDDLWF